MENQNTNTPKMHPMLIVTCVAVVIACLVGIASAMGWIGGNKNTTELTVVPESVVKSDNLATEKEIKDQMLADEAAKNQIIKNEEKKALPPVKKVEPKKPVPVVKETKPKICANCGVIESVQLVEDKGQVSGLGAGAGALAGGLLGNQVGGGSGKTAATIAGAVGGGYLGNRIESNRKTTHHYNIRVKYDDDTYQTFRSETPDFNVGERVRLNGSILERY